MAKEKNKEIKEAVEDYEVLTGDAEVKRLAEIRLMSELEEHSALATARAKGEEEGLRAGLEEGRKSGIEENRKEIAKKLLEANMPIKQIAKITGLTEDEIKKLKT